jgi:hypothetical protein
VEFPGQGNPNASVVGLGVRMRQQAEEEEEEEEEEEAVFVRFLKPLANPFAPVPRRFRAHPTLRPWTYSHMRVVKCMREENREQRWSRLLRCCCCCCCCVLLRAARLSCCV